MFCGSSDGAEDDRLASSSDQSSSDPREASLCVGGRLKKEGTHTSCFQEACCLKEGDGQQGCQKGEAVMIGDSLGLPYTVDQINKHQESQPQWGLEYSVLGHTV